MFNSIGRSSNFARAGKSAADETVRAFAASRRNSPKYGELAQKAAKIRTEEKIAVMKAEQAVAIEGMKAQTDVKTTQIQTDAKSKLKKSKRKAGALGAAGKLFGSAGQYLGEKRERREVGSEDSWYDSQIDAANTSYEKYEDLLGKTDTTTDTSGGSTSDEPTAGTGGNNSAGSTDSTKPTTSYQASGKKGKYSVADMTQFALDAGFTPEQARTMGAIGMAESGGNATIDTSMTIDPQKKNEYSIGLFQVNAQAHGDKLAKLGYTEDDLRDPVKAARVAKMVYDEVGSFKPWSVYKSGAYSQYLQ